MLGEIIIVIMVMVICCHNYYHHGSVYSNIKLSVAIVISFFFSTVFSS